MMKANAPATADLAAVSDEELMHLLACGFINAPAAELFRRHTRALHDFIAAQRPDACAVPGATTLACWKLLLNHCTTETPQTSFHSLLLDIARAQCAEYRDSQPEHEMDDDLAASVMAYAANLERACAPRRAEVLHDIVAGRSPARFVGRELSIAAARWLRQQAPRKTTPAKPLRPFLGFHPRDYLAATLAGVLAGVLTMRIVPPPPSLLEKALLDALRNSTSTVLAPPPAPTPTPTPSKPANADAMSSHPACQLVSGISAADKGCPAR